MDWSSTLQVRAPGLPEVVTPVDYGDATGVAPYLQFRFMEGERHSELYADGTAGRLSVPQGANLEVWVIMHDWQIVQRNGAGADVVFPIAPTPLYVSRVTLRIGPTDALVSNDARYTTIDYINDFTRPRPPYSQGVTVFTSGAAAWAIGGVSAGWPLPTNERHSLPGPIDGVVVSGAVRSSQVTWNL